MTERGYVELYTTAGEIIKNLIGLNDTEPYKGVAAERAAILPLSALFFSG